MDRQMTTLTEFLLARFAEDEATARDVSETGVYPKDAALVDGFDTIHISPTRVLADVEGKRAVVAAYESSDNRDLYGGCRDDCEWKALGYALECIAVQYADHPDFDESWRP